MCTSGAVNMLCFVRNYHVTKRLTHSFMPVCIIDAGNLIFTH